MKGKAVTTRQWKAVRQSLWHENDELVKEGGKGSPGKQATAGGRGGGGQGEEGGRGFGGGATVAGSRSSDTTAGAAPGGKAGDGVGGDGGHWERAADGRRVWVGEGVGTILCGTKTVKSPTKAAKSLAQKPTESPTEVSEKGGRKSRGKEAVGGKVSLGHLADKPREKGRKRKSDPGGEDEDDDLPLNARHQKHQEQNARTGFNEANKSYKEPCQEAYKEPSNAHKGDGADAGQESKKKRKAEHEPKEKRLPLRGADEVPVDEDAGQGSQKKKRRREKIVNAVEARGAEEEEKEQAGCGASLNEDELVQRLVGKVTIEKFFPKFGYFSGIIASYDVHTKHFTVRYVDDDEEELCLEQLRPYILKTEHAHLLKGWGSGG
jgi:hypothetical protein